MQESKKQKLRRQMEKTLRSYNLLEGTRTVLYDLDDVDELSDETIEVIVDALLIEVEDAYGKIEDSD